MLSISSHHTQNTERAEKFNWIISMSEQAQKKQIENEYECLRSFHLMIPIVNQANDVRQGMLTMHLSPNDGWRMPDFTMALRVRWLNLKIDNCQIRSVSGFFHVPNFSVKLNQLEMFNFKFRIQLRKEDESFGFNSIKHFVTMTMLARRDYQENACFCAIISQKLRPFFYVLSNFHQTFSEFWFLSCCFCFFFVLSLILWKSDLNVRWKIQNVLSRTPARFPSDFFHVHFFSRCNPFFHEHFHNNPHHRRRLTHSLSSVNVGKVLWNNNMKF